MCSQGKLAPIDVHPSDLGKLHKAMDEARDRDWDNFCQREPYEAQAIVKKNWYYHVLGRLFKGITTEIGEEVSGMRHSDRYRN